ncbi:MAG: hypothetical protein OHK0023_25660 [Anaerolineae bacterium]
MSVDAGYDGYFRDGQWLPLKINVSNSGADISGVLRVLPTDTAAAADAYVSPIDLPRQSNKQVFLYVPLTSQSLQIRVELATADRIIASETRDLRLVRGSDILIAVITESPRGGVDLRNFKSGIGDSYQANWQLENIPRLGEALRGLDALIITDADSGNLNTDQRQAIEDWVLAGGHLVVTGGPNWQRTAEGVRTLLPLQPNLTTTLTSFPNVAQFAGVVDALRIPTGSVAIVAQGVLLPDAQVLVEESSVPILTRRTLGGGVVDYLSIDPALEPFQSWANRGQFWFTLLTTSGSRPSWAFGITNPERALEAADRVRGLRLPDVLQLSLFLLIYIAIIGPLNYIILRRLGKREWAWVTIPVIVIVTAAVYYMTGFNMRGTQAIVNRLAVVQVWPGSARGQVDGVVGVLSPRRGSYSFSVGANMTLRTIISDDPNIGLVNNRSLTIEEGNTYTARDFPVDAGTAQAFAVSGYTEVLPIEGQATIQLSVGNALRQDDGPSGVRLVGRVTNTTGLNLEDAVVLAMGGSQNLGTLSPGESRSFNIQLNARQSPPLSLGNGGLSGIFMGRTSRGRYVDPYTGTVREIMGGYYTYPDGYGRQNQTLIERQEMLRRQTLLEAIAQDSDPSGGRGTDVFVAGWVRDQSPVEVDLSGAAYTTEDTTLYIYRLPVSVEALSPEGFVELPSAYLAWTPTDQSARRDHAPYNLYLQPQEVAIFRYTPLPKMRLSTVTEIRLWVQAGNNYSNGRHIVSLWDWETNTWVVLPAQTNPNVSNLSIRERPERFIGPENALQVRVEASQNSAMIELERVEITLYGKLASIQ